MIATLPNPETVESCESENSVVPPELQPSQPPAAPVRPTNFLIAFITFWLIPSRIGAHLAKGSFLAAVLAAILGLAFSALIVCTAPLWGRGDWWNGIMSVRVMLAQTVLGLATASAASNWNWLAVVGVLAIPFELLAAFLVFGILLFPWAAHGDSIRSAAGRSVKIALWSATVLSPLCVCWAACRWVLSQLPMTGMEDPSDSFPDALFSSHLGSAPGMPYGLNDIGKLICNGLLPVLFVLVFLRLFFKGAAKYAGPSIGPGFEIREPRCRSCGYVLIGLRLNSKCPECGKPVRESYCESKASRPPWNPELQGISFMREYFRMQFRCMSDASLLTSIPVNGHWAAARRFWWTICVCFGACLMVMYVTVNLYSDRYFPRVKDVHLLGVAILIPIVVHIGATFVTCIWARVRHGIRDPRVSVICTCYAAPMFCAWVFLLAIIIDVLLLVPPSTVLVSDFFFDLSLKEFAAGVAIVGLATTFLIWRRRIDQALASARFANF